MEMLDKVFQILFARTRRQMGDSNLEWAWRSASNKVAGYLALPFRAGAVVLAAGAVVRRAHARTNGGNYRVHLLQFTSSSSDSDNVPRHGTVAHMPLSYSVGVFRSA